MRIFGCVVALMGLIYVVGGIVLALLGHAIWLFDTLMGVWAIYITRDAWLPAYTDDDES